jgi:hypothetical protein
MISHKLRQELEEARQKFKDVCTFLKEDLYNIIL